MIGSPNAIILELLNQNRATVFRISDVAMITGETNSSRLVQRLRYGVSKGYLVSPCKGIYAKKDFSMEELACKLYVPSYISLDTVLQKAGVIFQYSSEISLVSYLSRSVDLSGKVIRYRKIKNEIIVDMRGINRGEINEATPERAFLDTLYLNSHYHFDNPSVLDKNGIENLLSIYNSSTLAKRAHKILSHV